MGTALALALALSGALAPKAHGACLTTVAENNCATFDASTPSTATQTFTSANLQTNRYFQLALLTTGGVSYTITGLSYSNDNITFTNFSPTSLNLNANGTSSYTNIVDNGTNLSLPFYLRYTLPTGVAPGSVIQGTLIANDNGSNAGGILSDSLNNYQIINRDSVSVSVSSAVPAPLPVLGAAGFFAYSRQLRRRIRF